MPPLPLLQSDTPLPPSIQVFCPFASLHFHHQIARERCMIAQRPGESGDIQIPPALFTSQRAPALAAIPAYNDSYDPYAPGGNHRCSAAVIEELRIRGLGRGRILRKPS
jgi:hypothetical protein